MTSLYEIHPETEITDKCLSTLNNGQSRKMVMSKSDTWSWFIDSELVTVS